MTATDELRRMLDERGVEWRCGSPNKIKWRHDGIDYVATNAWPRNDETRTKVALHSILTPEQAIAATLGSGMLTAEQVREAWCRHLRRDCLYDPPTPDWQAIADELNATLGAGTCHVESSIIDTYEYNRWEYELSCGHTIIWEDSEPPRYCPNCGRRIEQ